MDTRIGAHPHHLVSVARKFGLAMEEYLPMSIGQLKSCLRKGRPVLMMIQAWGEDKQKRPFKSYKGVWDEGHWIVAIGFDEAGVFFEDPSLEAIRGFIPYEVLEERWHDRGPRGKHIDHYGLAVWHPRSPFGGVYAIRARRID
jgi:uncharacterized protein YvpB